MAVARRWVGVLGVMGMMWISEVGVRCGRVGAVGDAEGGGEGDGVGALEEKRRVDW